MYNSPQDKGTSKGKTSYRKRVNKGKTSGKDKEDRVIIKVIQANLQKAKLAQTEITKRVSDFNKNQEEFIIFIQEPMVNNGKVVWQPNSCKKFAHSLNPRAMIYTDNKRQSWFTESLSTRDIAVIQTKIYNKSVLLVSVYLDINWAVVIPPTLTKVLK